MNRAFSSSTLYTPSASTCSKPGSSVIDAEVDEVLEDEPDVAERGGVLGHRPSVGAPPLSPCGPATAAKSPSASVRSSSSSRPAAASSSCTRWRVNLALISVWIISPSATSTSRSMARRIGVLVALGPQVHLDPLLVLVPLGHVGEAVGREVAVELAVEDVEDVAVELGGDAGGVVVGGDEAGRVLHEVGAEEEPVARRHLVGELLEELGARGRHEVADGAAEEGDHRRALHRQATEVLLEVADDRVDPHAGVALRPAPGRRRRSTGSHTSKGTMRSSVPAVGQAVEQQLRLGGRARAELDEGGGARAAGDRRRPPARGSRSPCGSGSTRAGG